MSEDAETEPELAAPLLDALASLAQSEDPALDGLLLQDLRRRMGMTDVPARIDRFVVIEPRGQGGMGVVYTAHDPRLERRVALKLVRAAGVAGVERGLAEARALARLSHPHVVTVYETGLHEGRVFVAMELVEGDDLRQWLDAGPAGHPTELRPARRTGRRAGRRANRRTDRRTWQEIGAVMLAAGRGLQAAHDAGVVHRDFKPENVLVGPRVQVADFGLAEATVGDEPETNPATGEPESGSSSDTITEVDRVAGTLAYMAPEQLRGRRADARSDQFAFCVTFYEALTGRRPFAGSTVSERLAAITQTTPGPIEAAPRWLAALVRQGLDPVPQARHPSLRALLDPLERRLRPRARAAWVVAALATLASVVALVGAWVGSGGSPDACLQAAAALDAVWTPKRREAIATAFAATQRPYAEHAQRFVDDAVSRYARAWTEANVEACRAQPSRAVLTRRQICLQRRRYELDALLTELEAADDALVRRSTSAVSALIPADRCDRPDPIADISDLDPDTQADLERIERGLARVRALRLSGRYAQADAVVEPLVAQSRDLGHEPTLADALMRRGQVQARRGELASAASLLHEALERGLASQADEVAALAAANLVDVRDRLGQPDEAERMGALAAAIHRRSTGDSTWPLLSNLEGAVLLSAGRDAEAVEVFAAGIAACEGDPDRHAADLLSMTGNRSQALLRLGRLDEAEASLAEAERRARALVGDEHPQVALLMISQAVLRNERGDPAGALEHQRRALTIWRRATPDPTAVEGSMLYNMGFYLVDLERFDEAIASIEQGRALMALHLGPEHPRVAMAHTGLGRAQLRRGDARAAMVHHEQALAILHDAIEGQQPHAGNALLEAARAALALDDLDRAMAWIDQGLAIYAQVPNPVMEGSLRFERAKGLSAQGETLAARTEAERARALTAQTDPTTHRAIERWLTELAPKDLD